MNKVSQAFDYQKFQQNPNLDTITREVESRYDKAALSDDDLAQVSAVGVATVPTMHPEILLGRHELPDTTDENRP
ncbi:MAG: hypothetical protein IKK75_11605 [Clostridia bacterium]|nr:hypothetical protein [Clostridia bacterium]